MKLQVKAHLALASVAILYGSNYIIAKGLLTSGFISPEGVIMIRITSAAVLLWILHALSSKEKVDKKDLPHLFVLAIFGISLNQLFFFKGLKATSPIHASLIMIMIPILVTIGSVLILKSKLLKKQIYGILLGLIGAAILIISSSKHIYSISSVYGDLLVFLNASSFALFLVFSKKIVSKYQPLTFTKWIFLFGIFQVAPFALVDAVGADFGQFTQSHWMSLIYIIIGATMLTYLFNMFALSKLKPTVVSFYVYFQPLIATSISLAIGQDKLDMYKVVSVFFLFSAVYLVTTDEGQ